MTFAEKALEALHHYREGYAGDWWNDCIYNDGYDDDATDALDHNASEIAVYTDGSYIIFDGQAWDAHFAAVGVTVWVTMDRGATWRGPKRGWVLNP